MIARARGKGSTKRFVGRFHHWDGNPSQLGRQLRTIYHEVFAGNLDRMLSVLLDEHPAGWDTLVADWSKPIGCRRAGEPHGPLCYCHTISQDEEGKTRANKPAQTLTEETAPAAGCMCAYVCSRGCTGRPRMRILARPEGDLAAAWQHRTDVLLDGAEPDWTALDQPAESGKS